MAPRHTKEVIQCSLYLRKSERRAEPYADKTCREVNSVLLKDSRCVNLGSALHRLGCFVVVLLWVPYHGFHQFIQNSVVLLWVLYHTFFIGSYRS